MWLPLLQIFINLVSFVSDSPQAYKALLAFFSVGGMLFFLFGFRSSVGFVGALFLSLFFFRDDRWRHVSITLFMEPLVLFNLGACYFFLVHKYRKVAALFFVLASFSRPEILLTAPVCVVGMWWYSRSLKHSLTLGVLYLPVTLFFLIVRITQDQFRSYLHFDFEKTSIFIRSVGYGFSSSYSNGFLGRELPITFFAILGIVMFFIKPHPPRFQSLRDRFIGVLFLVAFFLELAVSAQAVTPLNRNNVNLETGQGLYFRLSLYLDLCVFIVSGYGAQRLYDYFSNKSTRILLILLFTALLFDGFRSLAKMWPAPAEYKVTGRVLAEAERRCAEGDRTSCDRTIYLCKLDPARTTKQGSVFQTPLFTYTRWKGWKVKKVDCDLGNQSQAHVYLRFWYPGSIEKGYLEEIRQSCRTFLSLYTPNTPRWRELCF